MDEIYEFLEQSVSDEYRIPRNLVVSSKRFGLTLSRRAKKNWDNFVIIGGEKGSSKSTLALEVGMWQQAGPGFNEPWEEYAKRFISNNIIYSCPAKVLYQKLKEKYFKLPKYSSIVIDELKEFHKRQFASSQNIEIDKFMGTNRKMNNPETGEDVGNKTLIGCCDNIMSIDRQLRNLANHHVQVLTRGIAVDFVLQKSMPYTPDPSYSESFEKIVDKRLSESRGDFNSSSLISLAEQIKLCAKMKTFVAVIVYPTLDLIQPDKEKERVIGPIETLYLELDAKSKAEVEENKENVPMKQKQWEYIKKTVNNLIDSGLTQENALKEVEPIISRSQYFRNIKKDVEKQQKLTI
jgi:hypothetical protein